MERWDYLGEGVDENGRRGRGNLEVLGEVCQRCYGRIWGYEVEVGENGYGNVEKWQNLRQMHVNLSKQ